MHSLYGAMQGFVFIVWKREANFMHSLYRAMPETEIPRVPRGEIYCLSKFRRRKDFFGTSAFSRLLKTGKKIYFRAVGTEISGQ